MKRMRKWVTGAALFGLALAGGSALAQQSAAPQSPATAKQKKKAASSPPAADTSAPAQPAKFPLETLKIEGNRKLPVERIIAASGLKIGQGVDKSDFDAARTRLLATGGFESVGYSFEPSKTGSGFDGGFEVVEAMPMFPYRFEDLPAKDADLRAAIEKREALFGAEIPATRAVIGRYETALNAALENKITVAGKLITEKNGDTMVVFRPAGERPRISEVHFKGNSAIETGKLQMAFSAAAVGTEFSDSGVRLRLDASVRPLYEAKGRIGLTYARIESAKSTEPEVEGVSVTVTVNEGDVYQLGKIQFAGVPRDQFSELDKLASLRSKDTADFDAVKAGADRVTKRYKSKGYLHAATEVHRDVHEKDHIVDLTFTVATGPQYSYGKLDIKGLDVLSEPAIRKAWGEREGKPFDPDFPNSFLKDIKDQGVFDNLGGTDSETKVNEDAKTVDVTLVFLGSKPKEDRRKRLSF